MAWHGTTESPLGGKGPALNHEGWMRPETVVTRCWQTHRLLGRNSMQTGSHSLLLAMLRVGGTNSHSLSHFKNHLVSFLQCGVAAALLVMGVCLLFLSWYLTPDLFCFVL